MKVIYYYIAGILLCILVVLQSPLFDSKNSKFEVDNTSGKVVNSNDSVKKESFKGASEIVEIKTPTLDYSKKPDYAKPEAYKIGKCEHYYVLIWPSGEVDHVRYKTPEEAQKRINSLAGTALEMWVNSGGTAFEYSE